MSPTRPGDTAHRSASGEASRAGSRVAGRRLRIPALGIARRRRLPLATTAIVLVTTVFAVVQLVYPGVLAALARDPEAIALGEWWRLVTPLFVRAPDLWPQFILIALIAFVGAALERRVGAPRLLALYFVPGVAGEVASLVLLPYGAGASLGLCGLAGGWLVAMARSTSSVDALSSLVSIALVAELVGTELTGPIGGAALATLSGAAISLAYVRHARTLPAPRLLAAGGLLGAVTLTVLREQHGPPILVGAAIALAMSSRFLTHDHG